VICRGSSVSPRELNRSLSVVAGMGCGPKLAMDQLCGGLLRVRAQTGTQRKVHTFVNSFPSRLCAKLAPMVEWRRRRRQSVLVELEWLRRGEEDPGYIRQGWVGTGGD
jgi:hypothetical protein